MNKEREIELKWAELNEQEVSLLRDAKIYHSYPWQNVGDRCDILHQFSDGELN